MDYFYVKDINGSQLLSEIQLSSIAVVCNGIHTNEQSVTIQMASSLSDADKTTLDGLVSNHSPDYLYADLSIPDVVKVESQTPFASKKIKVNGTEKSLFKRVHGINVTIGAGATGYLDFVVPHNVCKFTGAEVLGTEVGDTLDFFVLDSVNNDYSGAPGSYYMLNQFGFDVQMPGGAYKNTSNYDADLYLGMVVSCAYKNNGASSKTIAMNVWLHEVK